MQDEQLRLSCLQKEMTLDELLIKVEKKEDALTMSKVVDNKEEVQKLTPGNERQINSPLMTIVIQHALNVDVSGMVKMRNVLLLARNVIIARDSVTLRKYASRN